MKYFLLVVLLNGFLSLNAQIIIKQTQPFSMEVQSLAILDNGKKVLAGSYDTKLYLIDAATGQISKEITGHKGFVLAATFCKEKNIVASAGSDQKIIIWDATTLEKKLEIPAHTDRINSLAFSPDGLKLVSASDDKTIIVWDLMTGGEIFKITDHSAPVTTVAISNDGAFIASGGWDKLIMLHSATTGNLIATYKGHRSTVNSVDFSDKGSMMVSGSDDNSIIVWKTDTVQPIAKFEYFSQPVTNVCFFPGDKYIFCTDGSGMLKVYNLSTKSMLEQKDIHNGSVKAMTMYLESGIMVTAGADKIVKIWNINEYLYFDCLKDKLLKISDLNRPKGEFETSEQYERRLKDYDRQKDVLVKECIRETEAIRKSEQEAMENQILSTYKYVFFPIQNIGTYNADTQEYPITYNGQGAVIKIGLDDAKSLKENLAKAKVKAIQRVVNGNSEVFNTELIHPVSGKSFPFGRQITASEDKLLGKFLQRAQ
jgi:WD40 repeat protein